MRNKNSNILTRKKQHTAKGLASNGGPFLKVVKHREGSYVIIGERSKLGEARLEYRKRDKNVRLFHEETAKAIVLKTLH